MFSPILARIPRALSAHLVFGVVLSLLGTAPTSRLSAQQFQTTVTSWSVTSGTNLQGIYSDGEGNTPGVTVFGSQQRSHSAYLERLPDFYMRGQATSYGMAEAGTVRAKTFAAALASTYAGLPYTGNGNVSASARAGASVLDAGTFYLNGYAAGTTVSLTAYVGVSGSLDASHFVANGIGGGQAFINWDVGLGGGQLVSTANQLSNGVDGFNGVEFSNGVFFFSANVVLGTSTTIRYSVGAGSGAGGVLMCGGTCETAQGQGEATADFSSTFKWGGISEVKLANGTVVDLSQLSMQSASGFNYITAREGVLPDPELPPVNPVPEPSSVALLATGLGALVLVRRLSDSAKRRVAAKSA